MAFHEGIPGHHLQLAIAGELSAIPEFRKHMHNSAYAEGWGLYTERLSDEMGLYSGAVERLGMLSADSMRASRLVVDTGLHALGWSREQAVQFMLDNSPLSAGVVRPEIDRYVVSPGQATSYMIGRLEIQRLRREAEQRQGDGFDVRAVPLGGPRLGVAPARRARAGGPPGSPDEGGPGIGWRWHRGCRRRRRPVRDEEDAMTTFTAWKFDTPEGAQAACDQLDRARADGLVKVIDRAVLEWPAGRRQAGAAAYPRGRVEVQRLGRVLGARLSGPSSSCRCSEPPPEPARGRCTSTSRASA